ncbi:olfactory receptor 4Q2-like [Xiphophorus couchianus]|uniref:olfactory receptor 4Q2-like n=1 Tax=Xiphophorus couchianus TaxID=32473 RepID=UPI001016A484|nr:olfactory receptor 4Q2-like [Xiphophorus couchianus]
MMDNVSVISMFTLSGFSGTFSHRVTLFLLTLLCYCVIWLVNLTIVVTIIMDKNLHEPMYIFLCNLCINGLYGTAGFYPKFLHDLLSTTYLISVPGCFLQGFMIHSSACADLFLLTLMAYDRYVAICRPLVYHSVMNTKRVGVYVFFAWITPFYFIFISSVTTVTSRFCGSHIPKIYCINFLISKLACSASIAQVVVPAFNYTFYFGHAVFIIWTYFFLVRSCQSSKENRHKFMQTCLPHLFTLIIVVVSLMFDLLYMRFGSQEFSENVKNLMSMEILVIPPVINPLIYGFRLTQLRKRVSHVISCQGSEFR